MNLRLPLSALGLLLAAACAPATPQPPAAVNHVHASPTPTQAPSPLPSPSGVSPTATPAPTPVPAAPALDRCHTDGLLISMAGSQGAAGTIIDTFQVQNTRTSPCTVYGYVGMLMLDGAGRPIPTRVVRGGFFGNQAGPASFVLRPGAAATFDAAWSDVSHGNETTCPSAGTLEVTPPDEFAHVLIPVSGWSLAPCNGGQISVTPIRAAGA